MMNVFRDIWWIEFLHICFTILPGTAQFPPDSYIRHKYACDSQSSCRTNMYSVECSLGDKIAMKNVFYGAKTYTTYCPGPDTQLCVSKKQCCKYHKDDCLIPYHQKELWDIFMECSHGQQCGWLYAKSIELKDKCQIRKKSNYIRADYQCISDSAFIDVCSQYTISAKSVHLHHTSIFRGIYNYNQCSCLITPDDCNSTASLKFRSFDIRLQSKGNFSHCNPESRIELIGQSELKQYYCEPQKFLYGFEDFHTSSENNMVFYLYKEPLQYPTKLWLEVQATLPGVGVRVTCGHRALHTAKRCPALPITGDRIVDVVDELPTKNPNKPIIISITPDGNGENGTDKDGPGEKPNTALAALIGGIVAGVVVLTLFLIVICIMLRKKRKKKEKADHVSYKIYLPTENQPQMNYYETVNDPDTHSVTVSSSTAGANIYHQPWEQRQGISLPNRANNGDLAYATSEEIKVLIEHMERDRKFINEGGEDDFPVPDKVYYRHISDYRYEPDDDSEDEDDDEDPLDGKNDSETESKSVNSEHSGTEKVESEDSKVEADRALDSDNESQKADSETVSGTFDGYESPRVSSFHPSDASSTHRSSSNRYSDYRSEFQRLVSQSSSKIAEDSDNDVPLEYAPPVSVAVNQSKLNTYMPGQSDDAKCNEVSLGSYGEPRISTDSGQGVDSESDASGHYYSSVYDKVKEQESQTRL